MANGLSRRHFSNGCELSRQLSTQSGRDRVREAVQKNPEWFCRAWATAESFKGNSRDECLRGLREIFLDPSFSKDAAMEIVQSLVGGPSFGGTWPGTFVTEGDARLAKVALLAVPSIDDTATAHAVALSLMSLSTNAWTLVVRRAAGGNADCRSAVTNLTNALMVGGIVPMPRSHANGLVVAEEPRGLVVGYMGEGHLNWDPAHDPRRVFDIKAVGWWLETKQLVSDAGKIVNEAMSASLMPDEIRGLCADFVSREIEIREQIKGLWDELRAAARGGDRSIRRWVTADGLTQMSFELLDHSEARTGVGPAVFFVDGQPFPHLVVEMRYSFLRGTFTERAELGHGGLLSSIDEFEKGSVQRGLRLLQNLMIVRELHRIAFSEGYCERNGNGHNGSGNGNGDRPVQARLAHFRRIGHLHRQDGSSYEPSEAALARVPVSVVVPPGHTYVASPPIHSRAMHPMIKPLVIETTTKGLV